MTAVFVLVALTAHSAAFDLTSIPLRDSDASSFHADVDGDGRAELCVLEERTMTAYRANQGTLLTGVTLEEGTQAFDIADIDQDGRPELIAIRGGRVVTYAIGTAGKQSGPADLFALSTPWPAGSDRPHTHAMVLEHNGEMQLALPSSKGFALHRMDGTVAATYPVRPPERANGRDEGWHVWSWPALRSGTRQGFARVVRGHDMAPEPELPAELGRTSSREWTHGSIHRAWHADEDDWVSWPWFPIRKDGNDALRARYAFDGDTKIRIQSAGTDSPAGAVHAYPGTIVVPRGMRDLPDFNGDGFTDLVVWNAPQPGMSIDSLTRSALKRSWPIRLTVHLFSPERGRFEPRPVASLKSRVAIQQLLMGLFDTPLGHRAFGDFDGDGDTDCGIRTDEKTFSVWLYAEGFPKEPTESRRFPEPITAVSTSGTGTITLRSEHAVHLLHAQTGD